MTAISEQDTDVLIRAGGFIKPPVPTSAACCLQLITFSLAKSLYESSNPSHH